MTMGANPLAILLAVLALAACGKMTQSARDKPGAGAVIYEATIITMDEARPSAAAVAVKDGKVLALGDIDDLVEAYSGATVDQSFARMTILPGFIDDSAAIIDSARPVAVSVTSAADFYHGGPDDAAIAARWSSPEQSGYRLYLIPDAAAFRDAYGETALDRIGDLASGEIAAPAPVLSMLSLPPASCAAAAGETGVLIEKTASAPLSLRIRADNDAARARVFSALAARESEAIGGRAVIETAGPIATEELARAGALGAAIILSGDPPLSGCAPPLPAATEQDGGVRPENNDAAETFEIAPPSLAGRIALSSRAAGLAPLRAAGARLGAPEGERLSPEEALEAITIDAAYALGLESEIGSIAPGKRADFTILERNPLATSGEQWGDIPVWGVVLGGEERPAGGD